MESQTLKDQILDQIRPAQRENDSNSELNSKKFSKLDRMMSKEERMNSKSPSSLGNSD